MTTVVPKSMLTAAFNFQEFTANGTWTKPSGVEFVMVEIWGGGGGAGTTTSGKGGDGGAGLVRVYSW